MMKIGERKKQGQKRQVTLDNRQALITTDTQIQARLILKSLEETVTWVRMTFKPKRLRALI